MSTFASALRHPLSTPARGNGNPAVRRTDSLAGLSERLNQVCRALSARNIALGAPFPAIVLFFCISDGDARAHTVHACGDTMEAAWQCGLVGLRTLIDRHGLKGKWLRIEQVDKAEATDWGAVRKLLGKVKRNYFRGGLALGSRFEHAFIAQELNANAMLYGGNAIDHAVVNEKNFDIYAKRRFGADFRTDFSSGKEIVLFSTQGVFSAANEEIREIDQDSGFRRTAELDENGLLPIIGTASRFLARQVKPDGTFVYGYHPCFDRTIAAYNTLRHASSTYAMIEAWEVTQDRHLKAAIDRALSRLTNEFIRKVELPDGGAAAFLVDVADEIKLGGNATAILALTRYCKATSTTEFLPLVQQLAAGIAFMQDRASGGFVHVLNYPDLSVKEAFRTVYYDGEAAFGLMRVYELTHDSRWLEIVEKALEHFIAVEHWRHHDHWLGYCVNELTRYRPLEKYFLFGIRNVSDYLDFVLGRITTFPTLLEMMMAARDMLQRIETLPQFHHLLGAVDLAKFRRALEFRANYLLNGYFWPELAMFFRNPERIVGSFFIRHHAFRVRIDDVEHYLSGLIAYRRHVADREAFDRLVERHGPARGTGIWSASEMEAAAGGKWIVRPEAGWSASGLCIHAPAMQPGNMVAVRSAPEERGISARALRQMQSPPAAMLVKEGTPLPLDGLPALQVADIGEAVLDIGRYARARMTGKILAVTGSAGKTTTVAMLAHALAPWGGAAKSAETGNLSHGVAWNLASIAPDTPHVVLELAIGRMARTARIARPDVAVFTNVLPAHLGDKSTIADIARTKSAVFQGVREGGVAVLNRDMLEWQTVHDAAIAAGLRILHYGNGQDCEFRLLDYDAGTHTVTAAIHGSAIRYRIGAGGTHMAMNSLAVLAAVSALGYEPGPAIAQFESFSALAGRGEKAELALDARRLLLIDDAYNANPGSMKAALHNLAQEPGARRVAVLGEMAELGPQGPPYHDELIHAIGKSRIDKVYLLGALHEGLWQKLSAGQRGHHAASLDELEAVVRRDLRDGDTVLFKGSHSTNIHRLVDRFKEAAGQAQSPALTAEAGHLRIELPEGTSALLYDSHADAAVFRANDAALHPPASITKLLTLCLVEERLNAMGMTREEKVEISAAAATVDSCWGFKTGERVSIDTLMHACAIVSSNEAANALAEWHSGSNEAFTRALNARAKQLKLSSTLFSSPSGLGRRQHTTVHDALLLARHVLERHPDVARLCRHSFFSWKGKRHPGTNRLLDIEGADGLKTGTLRGRGNHIVFSALRGTRRWIAVVLGAPTKNDRDEVVRDLMRTYAS